MALTAPHFLAISLAVSLAVFLVESTDLPLYELQARCAARCLVYNPQNASFQWGPYSFSSDFVGCITPCETVPRLKDCQRLCRTSLINTERSCNSTCWFLEQTKTTQQTHQKLDFPLKLKDPPKYNNETEMLRWAIPRKIYKTPSNLHLPVSFVVQSVTISEKQYQEIQSQEKQYQELQLSDLPWESHRPVFYVETHPESLFNRVNSSVLYLFRVATFNEYGTRGFSHPSLPVHLMAKGLDCSSTDGSGRYPLEAEFVQYGDFIQSASDGTMSVNVTWDPPSTGVKPSCYQVVISRDSEFISQDSETSDCEDYKQEVVVPFSTTWYTVRGLVSGCDYLVAIISEPPQLRDDGTIADESVASVVIQVPDCDSSWCQQPGHNHSVPRDVTVSYKFDPLTLTFDVNVTWRPPVITMALTGFEMSWGLMSGPIAIENRVSKVAVDGEPYDMYLQYMHNFHPGTRYYVQVAAIHYGEIHESSPKKKFETPSLYPGAPASIQTEVMDEAVLVSWSDPEGRSIYQPISYTVLWGTRLVEDPDTGELTDISVEFGHYGNLSVPSDELMCTVDSLEPVTEYYVQVQAVSPEGPGERTDPIQFWSPAPSDGGQSRDNIVLYIAAPLAAVAFICATAAFIVVIVNKRKKEFKLEITPTASSHEMTSISNGTDGTVAVRRYVPRAPPDGWEVDPTRINIVELLGEGFFGVVVKAEVMSRAISSPTTPPEDSAYAIELHRPRSVSTTQALLRTTSFSSAFGGRKTLVAIKMLKDSYCESGQREILDEIKMMKRIGSHPHIVNMLGCVTQSVPLMLLVEFISGGDLVTYLRRQRAEMPSLSVKGPMNEYTPEPKPRNAKSRSRSRSTNCVDEDNDDDEVGDDEVFSEKPKKPAVPALSSRLSLQDLTNFAQQIALGMHYLGSKGVIHRDLACRNVLVDGTSKRVKVSDFGLARAVYREEAYITNKRGFLPLKWMSVEAIFDRVFTTSSDVWSFGVVLWEICTLGGIPYPCIDDDVLATKLQEGYRMSKPENCSDELYEIMKRCWHPQPIGRPTFQRLASWLDGLNPWGVRNSSDRCIPVPWLSASDIDSEMSSPNPSVS